MGTTLRWKKNDRKDVEEAEKAFDLLRKKGYSFFKIAWFGRKGDEVSEFDKSAKGYIVVPPKPVEDPTK